MTCVQSQVELVEVILLDLFTLNYVVTLGITLITGRFIKLLEIQWKHGNSAATGKFHGLARNSMARGKLWALFITQFGMCKLFMH